MLQYQLHEEGYFLGKFKRGFCNISQYKNIVDTVNTLIVFALSFVFFWQYDPEESKDTMHLGRYMLFANLVKALASILDAVVLIRFGKHSKAFLTGLVLDLVFYAVQLEAYSQFPMKDLWVYNWLLWFFYFIFGIITLCLNRKAADPPPTMLYLTERSFFSFFETIIWTRMLGDWRPHWLVALLPVTAVSAFGIFMLAPFSLWLIYEYCSSRERKKDDVMPITVVIVILVDIAIFVPLSSILVLLQPFEDKGTAREFYLLIIFFCIVLNGVWILISFKPRKVLVKSSGLRRRRNEPLLHQPSSRDAVAPMNAFENHNGMRRSTVREVPGGRADRALNLIQTDSNMFFQGADKSRTEEMVKERVMKNEICCVCYENKPNTFNMPCRHGGFCELCAQEVFNRKGVCPLCRTKISSVIVYEKGEDGKLYWKAEIQEKEGSEIR